jgi:hypothetical protein
MFWIIAKLLAFSRQKWHEVKYITGKWIPAWAYHAFKIKNIKLYNVF